MGAISLTLFNNLSIHVKIKTPILKFEVSYLIYPFSLKKSNSDIIFEVNEQEKFFYVISEINKFI